MENTEKKDLYELDTILEVYESLEEKKGIEKLIDNVTLYIFNNDINEENVEEFKNAVKKITIAYSVMKDKFSEVTRDEGTRYFEHLRAVSNIVLELESPSIDKVLIALYHDAIEDVGATFEIIDYLSSDPKIALAVEIISKKDWQEYSDDKNEGKKLRNEDYFGHLKLFEGMLNHVRDVSLEKGLILNDDELKIITQNLFDVKFADRIHNLSTQWDENNLEKVERKTEETKTYFLESAKNINPGAYKKLKSLILTLEVKLARVKNNIEEILDK